MQKEMQDQKHKKLIKIQKEMLLLRGNKEATTGFLVYITPLFLSVFIIAWTLLGNIALGPFFF